MSIPSIDRCGNSTRALQTEVSSVHGPIIRGRSATSPPGDRPRVGVTGVGSRARRPAPDASSAPLQRRASVTTPPHRLSAAEHAARQCHTRTHTHCILQIRVRVREETKTNVKSWRPWWRELARPPASPQTHEKWRSKRLVSHHLSPVLRSPNAEDSLLRDRFRVRDPTRGAPLSFAAPFAPSDSGPELAGFWTRGSTGPVPPRFRDRTNTDLGNIRDHQRKRAAPIGREKPQILLGSTCILHTEGFYAVWLRSYVISDAAIHSTAPCDPFVPSSSAAQALARALDSAVATRAIPHTSSAAAAQPWR